jgi:hypothetical protein
LEYRDMDSILSLLSYSPWSLSVFLTLDPLTSHILSNSTFLLITKSIYIL